MEIATSDLRMQKLFKRGRRVSDSQLSVDGVVQIWWRGASLNWHISPPRDASAYVRVRVRAVCVCCRACVCVCVCVLSCVFADIMPLSTGDPI